MQFDISRLEAKIKIMEAQLAVKDRELPLWPEQFVFVLTPVWILYQFWNYDFFPDHLEANSTATLKAQIEKLQQERDELKKGHRVKWPYSTPFLLKIILFILFVSLFMESYNHSFLLNDGRVRVLICYLLL